MGLTIHPTCATVGRIREHIRTDAFAANRRRTDRREAIVRTRATVRDSRREIDAGTAAADLTVRTHGATPAAVLRIAIDVGTIATTAVRCSCGIALSRARSTVGRIRCQIDTGGGTASRTNAGTYRAAPTAIRRIGAGRRTIATTARIAGKTSDTTSEIAHPAIVIIGQRIRADAAAARRISVEIRGTVDAAGGNRTRATAGILLRNVNTGTTATLLRAGTDMVAGTTIKIVGRTVHADGIAAIRAHRTHHSTCPTVLIRHRRIADDFGTRPITTNRRVGTNRPAHPAVCIIGIQIDTTRPATRAVRTDTRAVDAFVSDRANCSTSTAVARVVQGIHAGVKTSHCSRSTADADAGATNLAGDRTVKSDKTAIVWIILKIDARSGGAGRSGTPRRSGRARSSRRTTRGWNVDRVQDNVDNQQNDRDNEKDEQNPHPWRRAFCCPFRTLRHRCRRSIVTARRGVTAFVELPFPSSFSVSRCLSRYSPPTTAI